MIKNIVFPAIIISIFASSLRGQQKEAGIFVDSTGRVFVQANMPAYFYIAPSENPDQKLLVPSQDPKSNPMYFDGNGAHFIKIQDAESKSPITFEVFADGVAPKASLSFVTGQVMNARKRFYVEAGSKAQVIAKDNLSGVKGVYASLNNSPYSQIGTSIDIGNSSDNKIRIYAVDNVGNISDTLEFRVITAIDSIVKINNIYFDTNSSKLRPESRDELNELITVLSEYPEIRIELRAHTDCRGDSNYNLTLSERRAESVANYLINKGINSKRVTFKGYGDTTPINECVKGTNCSEEKHQENRRVEFKILPIK